MKIGTISDTHWEYKRVNVPDCDILLHAGDVSGRGKKEEIIDFLDWYSSQSAHVKVLIAGNHDFGFEKWPEWCKQECEARDIVYLNDSLYEHHFVNKNGDPDKIRIWGSPVQPAFHNWAFNRARTHETSTNIFSSHDFGKEPIQTHWELIPQDVDIIITHGPSYEKLDKCKHGERVGCELLAKKILEIKPKMHVFGHIHEDRGVLIDKVNNITYVNTSSLDLHYQPHKDEAFVFDWEKTKTGDSRGRDF